MTGQHHHHHHIDPASGDRRVAVAVAVNLGLTVVQIIGGILSGSLALIADAIHNLSDGLSLVLAFAARRIARRPADENMTFGYGRAEIVAALINYTTLIIIGLYLLWEAIWRFVEPTAVDGWLVVLIAAVALAVDLATAMLTYAMSKTSINIRAAFLHNLADALGSVAVIVSGTLILLYDWRLVDPLVTLAIAGYILWQSLAEIGKTIRILMLGSPPEIELDSILAEIRGTDGIADVHHVHLWQMQENQNALEAHLVIEPGAWAEADTIKSAVREKVGAAFEISHFTLETECSVHACKGVPTVGHAAAD